MSKKNENVVVFGLTTFKGIENKIAKVLGIEKGEYISKKFADGEIFVESKTSVRNKTAFIIQSIETPINDNLMELLLFIDALKRSSVGEINLIIPYFGYARQDRKVYGRQAISAKLVANLLTIAGADRVISFDIHSEQIVGFFDIPMDNLKAVGLLAKEIEKENLENLTIVSPDHGGTSRARQFAKLFNAPLAVVDKRRVGDNQIETNFILGDVEGRNIVIFDDMVDTGGTVQGAAKILKEKKANRIFLATTHSLFSEKNGESAIEKILDSGIEKIITTKSINVTEKIKGYEDKINRIDLTDILTEVISNHISNKSITTHFIKKYNTNL